MIFADVRARIAAVEGNVKKRGMTEEEMLAEIEKMPPEQLMVSALFAFTAPVGHPGMTDCFRQVLVQKGLVSKEVVGVLERVSRKIATDEREKNG